VGTVVVGAGEVVVGTGAVAAAAGTAAAVGTVVVAVDMVAVAGAPAGGQGLETAAAVVAAGRARAAGVAARQGEPGQGPDPTTDVRSGTMRLFERMILLLSYVVGTVEQCSVRGSAHGCSSDGPAEASLGTIKSCPTNERFGLAVHVFSWASLGHACHARTSPCTSRQYTPHRNLSAFFGLAVPSVRCIVNGRVSV
jgi:hypothetical protein